MPSRICWLSDVPVGKTVGNFNNHVGVPLSILRLPDDCRAAVLEMGMNHAGEIRELAAIAKPQIGVVTNVGYAHVEFFDSIEGVAAAKRELIEELAARRRGGAECRRSARGALSRSASGPHGHVRISRGDADVRAESLRSPSRRTGTRFRAVGVDFETGLAGRHGVSNLLAAIAVARDSASRRERLREPVRTFTVGKMRGERFERNGMIVWNDCYNSNPEAVRSMLDVLRETPGRAPHRRAGRDARTWRSGRGAASPGGRVRRGAGNRSRDRRARRARKIAWRGAAGRARIFRRAGEAGDYRPLHRARRATRSCSKARAACTWNGRWKG